MGFFSIHAQGFRKIHRAGDLFAKQPPLGLHLARRNAVGHESSIAVATFQKSLAGQSLVDAKDRVLIDRQFGGQHPNRRQPLAGLERSAGALRPDLSGDLPSNGHSRGCFDANMHGLTLQ